MRMGICNDENDGPDRRKIRLIEVNAKCHYLKKLPVKGLRGKRLSEFINRIYSQFLAYIQSCWYFQLSFVICTLPCCPSPLLSFSLIQLYPLDPLPCVNKNTFCKYAVCKGVLLETIYSAGVLHSSE